MVDFHDHKDPRHSEFLSSVPLQLDFKTEMVITKLFVVDADSVHKTLDWLTLMDVLENAHRSSMPKHDRYALTQNTGSDLDQAFLTLPAWMKNEGIGVKLTTTFPANREKFNIPTVNSVFVWFNGETGVPEALIDGEALIFRKTAAVSALGSRLLSRPGAKTMLMIGAGALAPYLIRAHRAARPSLERILVWNRTRANAAALVDALATDRIHAEVVDNLESSLPDADLISAATMSRAPLVKGALLKDGAHVDLVGSYMPHMREGDDKLLERSEVFVDSYSNALSSGELLDPIERGVFTRSQIEGDMSDLCTGLVSRGSEEAVTLFKNAGGAHLDYFTAREVIRAIQDDATTHSGLQTIDLNSTRAGQSTQ